jgi:hypothetical protein
MNIHIDETAEIEGNRLTVTSDHTISVYNLPRGARRVTIMTLGPERSALTIGGFKSTTVVVSGPTDLIEKLREGVLA